MKTKNSTFTVSVLIAFAILSCKKDHDSEPQDQQTLLAKTTTSTYTTTYQYNSNNRANTAKSVNNANPSNYSSITYTHNSSGQLTEYFIDDSTTPNDTKLVYTYNSNGQLTDIDTYTVAGGVSTLISTTNAVYETSSKINLYYKTAGSPSYYLDTVTYLDAKGNIVKLEKYNSSGVLQVTSEYTSYDDKNNPGLSIPKTSFTKSVNNILSLKITSASGSVNNATYTYEYNSDGYPLKKTDNSGNITYYEYVKK